MGWPGRLKAQPGKWKEHCAPRTVKASIFALRAEGCDEVQGFLVSRPVVAEVITELLAGGAVYPGVATTSPA